MNSSKPDQHKRQRLRSSSEQHMDQPSTVLTAAKSVTESSTQVLVGFFALGLLVNTTFGLIISATQDILGGTHIPSTVVLIINTCPDFVAQLLMAYLIPQGHYSFKVAAFIVFKGLGFGLLIFGNHIYTILCGVAFSSLGIGIGFTTFLSLAISRHEQQVLSFYVIGDGVGLFTSQLMYTGLTTWFCIPPKTTFAILACSLPLVVITYCLLTRRQRHTSQQDSHHDVPYHPLAVEDADETFIDTTQTLTIREKLLVTGQTSVITISIFIVRFVQYDSLKSIATTLAFPHSSFSPRGHYQYYSLLFELGSLVGKVYLPIFKCISSVLFRRFVVKRLWMVAIISVALLLVFLFASWFRFIHSVNVVMFLSFLVGMTYGLSYTNGTLVLQENVKSRHKEFVISIFSLAISSGTLAAGLVGLHVEPHLFSRCVEMSSSSDYCWTRNMAGNLASAC